MHEFLDMDGPTQYEAISDGIDAYFEDVEEQIDDALNGTADTYK